MHLVPALVRGASQRLHAVAAAKRTDPRGADNIGTYHKTEQTYRKWCKTCGGHIMTEHPGLGLSDVYAAVIPDLAFKPGLYVNYRETVLHMKDGLPKLKDFPKAFGGSGIELPE
jgi:hypothetical protein